MMETENIVPKLVIKERFNGYLPIVVDIETSGLHPLKHALLEIAAYLTEYNALGEMVPTELYACHILPFEGALIDPESLLINKIDPYHPFRFAVSEQKALEGLFKFASDALQKTGCRRAVLVGHNAHFDLSFIQAAIKRCRIQKNPFHAFTCFDTATMAALMLGQTVLAKALDKAKIPFDKEKAHTAIYDARQTAELFCYMVNRAPVVV